MQEDRPTQYYEPTTLPDASIRGNRGPVLILGLLGAGLVISAGLAGLGFYQAHMANAHTATKVAAAVKDAQDKQKAADALASEQAAESPYRSYVAPIEYGSFEIKFPKDWSGNVAENRNGSVQVNLELNPDIIRTQNNTLDKQATVITLNQKTLIETTKYLDNNKSLKRNDITVSGIPSVEYNGTFDDKRTARMVVVPVRDKTIVFTNENTDYATQFSQILQQSHINP